MSELKEALEYIVKETDFTKQTFAYGQQPDFYANAASIRKVAEKLIKNIERQESETKAQAVEDAAKDIYLNDDVIGLLVLGNEKKKPDNYRAEGWFQCYQWLQKRAQELRNGKNIDSNTRAGDKRISPPKEVSPVRDEAFYNDIMERDAGIIKEQAVIINKLNQKINQLRQKLKAGDKDDSA